MAAETTMCYCPLVPNRPKNSPSRTAIAEFTLQPDNTKIVLLRSPDFQPKWVNYFTLHGHWSANGQFLLYVKAQRSKS